MNHRNITRSMMAILCAAGLAFTGTIGAQAAGTGVGTVAPEGFDVTLYDYTIGMDSCATPAANLDTGINKGSNLKFFCSPADDAGDRNVMDRYINRYGRDSGYEFPANASAERTLNANGSPVMRDDTNHGLITQDLGYLFDSSQHDGKTVYRVANPNLLRDDGDGQYTFDGYWGATYDKASGSFDTYYIGQNGLFFPFDPQGGDWTAKNHYFGMKIEQDFWQPTDGLTLSDKPMKFSFQGDDDVWIYIDDVLVADLGGINIGNATIDFNTGAIHTHKNMPTSAEGGKGYDTTIREQFEKAGVTPEGGFDGDTFADNTGHTLTMFYLERGNYASTFGLSYNLQPVSYPLAYELNGGSGVNPNKEQ